jgi:hypothetical protein
VYAYLEGTFITVTNATLLGSQHLQ